MRRSPLLILAFIAAAAIGLPAAYTLHMRNLRVRPHFVVHAP